MTPASIRSAPAVRSRAWLSLMLSPLLPLVVSCERGAAPRPDPVDESGSLLSEPVSRAEVQPARGVGFPLEAADAIARARCSRDRRCQPGGSRGVPLELDCFNAARAEWRDELNRWRCPRGVNELALARCLGQIETSACEEESWGACREADICSEGRR